MEELRHDVRFALRSLRRNPAYAVAVVLTLALGIGANTAMFSVIRGVLLQPLPQANGERIVRLFQPNTNAETTGLSPLEIADYRAGAGSLEAIVEYHSMPFTFIGEVEPERLQTGVVSADFFDVMGVRALIGRTFRTGEDQPGSDPVLVLSYEYWQRAFGGDRGVVGAQFRMNDRTHTVVGVLPRIPQHPNDNDVYMPVSSCPFRSAPSWAENRSGRLTAFALLRPGQTPRTVETDLMRIAAGLHATYPAVYPSDERWGVAAVPLAELLTAGARPSILLLLGATSFLLLIVCANVVGLAVVRLIRRDAELSTRLALGASRARLARQLVTESGVLALAGGAGGVIVAAATLRLLVPFVARFSPRAPEIRLDAGVLAFTTALALGTGLLAGLLPALMRLRADGRGDTRTTAGVGHVRVRGALIIAQVAVSLVLLVGAGLMMRSLVNLERVNPGFDPARVLTARVDLNWTRYDNADRTTAFFQAVEQRLRAVPTVQNVAFASSFPLNGDPASPIAVTLADADPTLEPPRVAINAASSDYFAALGIPLLRGRVLTDDDARPGAELVAVVTRATAQRLWGDADPIGRRISANGGQTWGTIVGVVGDVRQELERDYEAIVFVHQYRNRVIGSRMLVRASLAPAALERLVRDVVADVDPEQPVTDLGTIEQFRAGALAPRRVVTALLGAFAGIALLITAVGLAGLIAFSVAARGREIGIRLALGATRTRVVAMVLRQALVLTGAGLVLGTIAALVIGRSITGLLFGVPAADPVTFAAVAVVLFSVAGLASLAPTRRATRIEPVRALRGP